MARMRMAVVIVGVAMAFTGAVFALQAGAQGEKPKETQAATADPITGEWEGTVALPDGNMPFFMKLKLEKDRVSGEIGNQEGAIPCTGTWADSKLTLTFTYRDGPVSMTGAFKEEQLGGDLNMGAGQMAWVAKKKA